MSSPAASWALTTHATASRYCSRKIESPSADLNDRPRRLSVNQRGRGYEPVMAVGSIRFRVTFSIDSSWAISAREPSALRPQQLALDLLQARRAAQGHGRLELVAQNVDDALHSRRAVDGQAPQIGTPDQDRAGAERDRLDDVRPPANAAVEEEHHAPLNGLGDGRQRLDRRRRGVEVAATVVGDDDA